MSTKGTTVRLRLLFADEGNWHHEEIQVPAEALERHERIIDLLQEDPDVLRLTYVDLDRLCSAHVLGGEGRSED
ncbi:MAG: hypothetical protein EA352_02290 [Gemmatimonadales bacterium]|nr:MAG: hypothetical protein EA352_02290 [Gemmatimonadales bacterium]